MERFQQSAKIQLINCVNGTNAVIFVTHLLSVDKEQLRVRQEQASSKKVSMAAVTYCVK